MNLLKKLLLYSGILTIPLFFLLNGHVNYYAYLPLWETVRFTVFFFFVSIFLFVLFLQFLSVHTSLILTNLLQLQYLFFETFRDYFLDAKILSFKNYSNYFLFLASLDLIFLLIFSNWKNVSKKKFIKFTSLLFSLFVLLEFGKLIVRAQSFTAESISVKSIEFDKINIRGERPDIYFIVLDEYPGSQTLKNNYNFDNSEFSDDLKEFGFFVAPQSNSNYDLTSLSMLSTFSMNYLRVNDGVYNSVNNYIKSYSEIRELDFFKFLKSNGYLIRNYSFFQVLDHDPIGGPFIPVKKHLLLSKTLGYVLTNDILNSRLSNSLQKLFGTSNARLNAYNKNVISLLKTFKCTSEPDFVYAHLMMPHSPYLIDENGKEREFIAASKELNAGYQAASFIPYIKYTNNVVHSIVNNLIDQPGEKIIVIVGDHGDRLSKINKTNSRFDNLIAVYPKRVFDGVDSIYTTNVNLLRVLLNSMVEQKMPLLINVKHGEKLYE